MTNIIVTATVGLFLAVALIISIVASSFERRKLYKIIEKGFLLLASKDASEYKSLIGEDTKRESIPSAIKRARAKWHHER